MTISISSQVARAKFSFPDSMALFLDFDGTLASFQDDPDAVHLTKTQTALLLHIKAQLGGALALISGRDVRDLSKRAPKAVWRLGNHGLYTAAPNCDPYPHQSGFPQEMFEAAQDICQSFDGVWIEQKGPILAVHHRANPDAGNALTAKLGPVVKAHADYLMQVGHNVIELKPKGANKGRALTAHMGLAPFAGRVPVMIGDDTTDEDGFAAAAKLGGFGVKIGAGTTQARYRLETIPSLYSLLETHI